ncbi:MAG: NADH-dependent [FeFe] hydrogenase, group A6 [Spirochaetales bacterium]|nr:NADH-dependent [FeFe] hydrogenase, group A6 [Spirochaetales bacterium]
MIVNVTIDSQIIPCNDDQTILTAAQSHGIKIPTLCFHEDLGIAGNCRLCLVEIEGEKRLQPSCALKVKEGMIIHTNTDRIRKTRRQLLSLLLSEHNGDCLHCDRSGHCELQSLATQNGLEEELYPPLKKDYREDISSPSIKKDDSKCIRCQRCVRTCHIIQDVNALAVTHRGADLKISTFLDKPLHNVICTNCGQCVNRCPTGALTEQSAVEDVWHVLSRPELHVVVQTAPAVRIALGEQLGYSQGGRVTGKMVSALRRLGFDKVFDTNFTADMTIMEEGTELLNRLKSAFTDNHNLIDAKPLPQFSSCSPGWIKYLEHQYPGFLGHLSTCKSPQQMFGTLAKTYYADRAGIDPSLIRVVSIMPCTAKKFEAQRPEMCDSGYRDVDFVLTTRELGKMLDQGGIDFSTLEQSSCDSLLGTHSGAAVIFGATGGVMEAALRTVYEIVTGREVPYPRLDITPVRGMEGVKEAEILIENPLPDWSFLEGITLKVAVSHGLSHARKLLDKIQKGEKDYHFVEFMACPGGCLGGGGQPIPTTPEIRLKRMEGIYDEDRSMAIRKSHENPEVHRIYQDFLGEPCSPISHKLLHTEYTARELY